MTDRFNRLCESIGVIQTTTKSFYPRNVKLSENFLRAFREEYENQRKTFSENSTGKDFRPHSERILKALRFHMRELDEQVDKSTQAIQRKMGPTQPSESDSSQKSPTVRKFKNPHLRRSI